MISILIDRVFLYDDNITIVFNTQDKSYEAKMPDIKELESSFMGNTALPLVLTALTFIVKSFKYIKI